MTLLIKGNKSTDSYAILYCNNILYKFVHKLFSMSNYHIDKTKGKCRCYIVYNK